MRIGLLTFATLTLACTPGGGGGSSSRDCRLAQYACADGFDCRQTGADRYECILAVLGDAGAGGAGGGGQGGGGGEDGGAGAGGAAGQGGGGQGGAGGQEGGPPGGVFVEISNPDMPGLERNEAGDAWIAEPGEGFNVDFDLTISAAPGCTVCEALLVVGVGDQGLVCPAGLSPELAGQSARLQVPVVAPEEPGRYPVRWRQMAGLDCMVSGAAFGAAAGPQGELGFIEVRNPTVTLASVETVSGRFPGGADVWCQEAECPEGTLPVAGGGFHGGDTDVVVNARVDERTWQRCLVGERPNVGPQDNMELRAACVRVDGGRVRVTGGDGESVEALTSYGGPCRSDETVLGGGFLANPGWRWTGAEVYDEGDRLAWSVQGLGARVPLAVQITCVPRLTGVEVLSDRVEMPVGGACHDIDCGAGRVIISAHALWGEALDPDQLRPASRRLWVFCAFNEGPDAAPVDVYAVCAPEP